MGFLFDKCDKSYKKRKLDEMQHFLAIKKGLKESMININQTLNNFDNWDELLSLKEESPEDNKFQDSKEIKNEFEKTKTFFDFLGVLFCLSHLIGVQASIIILNALFNEIFDQFNFK